MNVIKRDGTIVPFDKNKIFMAVDKAVASFDNTENFKNIKNVLSIIIDNIVKEDKDISVEEIQDRIVTSLMKYPEYDKLVLKYERYRTLRTNEREINKMLKEINEIITVGSTENANKNSEKPNVKRCLTAGEVSKYIACNKIIPLDIVMAHINKIMHWHDLDFMLSPMTNCSILNISDMLENGTCINNAHIVQPNSLEVASNITAQIVADVANSQYGGISIHALNKVWSKYAKKTFAKIALKYLASDYMSLEDLEALSHYQDYLDDNFFEMSVDEITHYESTLSNLYKVVLNIVNNKFGMNLTINDLDYHNETFKSRFKKVFIMTKLETEKAIYDACQSYEYQMNTLSSASQTPFSTISFDVPKDWYSECIIKSYLKVRMSGIDNATGKIAIFPKINMFVVDGYNLKEGDPYYDILKLTAKCISKSFYPDILHVSKENYELGNYYTRMGCRSRVSHEKIDGEYRQEGRFNMGVHSLNLTQPALLAKDIEDYFRLLKERSAILQKSMVARYDYVKNMKASSAPILFMYGGIARLKADETIEKLLKTAYASISYGYVGISDAVNILLGENAYEETKEGKELGIRIIEFMSAECDRIKQETGLPVSLYGTPAESLIHNFFVADKRQYADLMPKWLLDKEYYENSYHFRSSHQTDAFSKLEFESDFVPYSKGGNIVYSEIPTAKNNAQAIIDLIQYAHSLGTIEYQGFNVGADECLVCGYTGEIRLKDNMYTCPQCGNNDKYKLIVIKRLCGYLAEANYRRSSRGRDKEVNGRVNHLKVTDNSAV